MIKQILDIARLAGSKVLEIYGSDDFEIQLKKDKDNSPLTRADLTADEVIINGLKKVSGYPIITEESCVDYDIRKKWETFWLVDPLDGTKNFISKDGEFTINIALIEKNKPVLGVVHAPVLEWTYWAEKNNGAYKNGSKINNDSQRTDLIGSDSRFHSTKETLDFLEKHNIETIKRYGSALKLCKLAEGEIDVYPRLNGTKEWDTAAAHIIANEAGCKLLDIVTKKELVYNKENVENNFFIASRNDLNFVS